MERGGEIVRKREDFGEGKMARRKKWMKVKSETDMTPRRRKTFLHKENSSQEANIRVSDC